MNHSAPPSPGQGWLIDQFTAFHARLLGLRRGLVSSPATAQGAAKELTPEQVREALYDELQMLGQQARGLGGRFSQENQAEARYLMAAIADEMLIAMDWPHRDTWIGYLLEERLCGTRCAGDRVFDLIDALLLAREPDRREMAMLYLFALALGFRGRYRDSAADQRHLLQLRASLFRLAHGREPDAAFSDTADMALMESGRRLMPQPYLHTVADALPVLLPNPRRWVGIFWVAAASLLLAAYVIWTMQTAGLRAHFDATDNPVPAAPAGARGGPSGSTR